MPRSRAASGQLMRRVRESEIERAGARKAPKRAQPSAPSPAPFRASSLLRGVGRRRCAAARHPRAARASGRSRARSARRRLRCSSSKEMSGRKKTTWGELVRSIQTSHRPPRRGSIRTAALCRTAYPASPGRCLIAIRFAYGYAAVGGVLRGGRAALVLAGGRAARGDAARGLAPGAGAREAARASAARPVGQAGRADRGGLAAVSRRPAAAAARGAGARRGLRRERGRDARERCQLGASTGPAAIVVPQLLGEFSERPSAVRDLARGARHADGSSSWSRTASSSSGSSGPLAAIEGCGSSRSPTTR